MTIRLSLELDVPANSRVTDVTAFLKEVRRLVSLLWPGAKIRYKPAIVR
jgi:hypothetical protein